MDIFVPKEGYICSYSKLCYIISDHILSKYQIFVNILKANIKYYRICVKPLCQTSSYDDKTSHSTILRQPYTSRNPAFLLVDPMVE